MFYHKFSFVFLSVVLFFGSYCKGRIVVDSIKNGHPRLLMSQDDIELMVKRVKTGKQPWAGAWKNMKAEIDDWLGRGLDKPDPYVGDYSLDYFKRLDHDGGIARDFALAYHITGNDRYAEIAVDYLYGWATAKPMPGMNFDPEKRYPNSGMEVGRTIIAYLWAYDLLYDHKALTFEKQSAIKYWVRSVERVIHEGIKRWDENDYFGKQDYQNHLISHTAGLLAIGYALADEKLVQYAVDSDENPRDMVELISGAILVEGDKTHDDRGPKVQTGEIFDRYRHYGSTPKGLQYANLTLLLLGVSAEMCYQNGINFFEYTSPGGENLQQPFDFYADFYRTGDSSLKGGYYSGEDYRIGQAGDSPAIFELGYKHYRDSSELEDIITEMERTEQKIWIMGRAVLTHGAALE